MARLQDLLRRSTQRNPDGIALLGETESLTYGELDLLSDRMAHLLREHGCRSGSRVLVAANKSPSTVAALLAVLKAGGAYVPVDCASPPARVARILDSAEPHMVFADTDAADLVDGLHAGRDAFPLVAGVGGPVEGERFATVFSRDDTSGFDGPPRPAGGGDDELAHLLFTSGSTGLPKGVMISHANVLAFLDWAVGHFGIRADDRLSGHPPLHFDLSSFDLYATLAVGAELHLVPRSLGVDPKGLARWIRNSELTQWFSVPTVLSYLAAFDAVEPNDFPALRRLLWCGEVLPTPVLAHWMRLLPHVRFTNLYGPTEATIASSYYDVPEVPEDEARPVPIGRACDGEDIVVLDADLSEVGPDEIGDLYIGGTGIALGYWREPQRTAEAFVPDPRAPGSARRLYRTGDLAARGADGITHFFGRTDSQIKSRGYRVELGETEAALHAIEGVRAAAVVGVDLGGFAGVTICAAYSTTDGTDLPPAAVRNALTRSLPTYMLPSRWAVYDDLPTNANGKVDRPSLRDHFAAQKRQRSAR